MSDRSEIKKSENPQTNEEKKIFGFLTVGVIEYLVILSLIIGFAIFGPEYLEKLP